MDEIVERECLLFEAGDYPDRGVTITPDDLRDFARNSARELPVRVEHLRESPFDGALGVVTRLREAGGKLWGTLRQPRAAWEFARCAGARALSVALDTGERRLTEVSFVCHPRVAEARVFGENRVCFHSEALFKEEQMSSVKTFAEGLIRYVRQAIGTDETPGQEPSELEQARETLRRERTEGRIAEFKRQGLLRATDKVEGLARVLLMSGEENVIRFGEEETPVSSLFSRFLEANGAVVPMGELAKADAAMPEGAAARLIAMARERAKDQGLPYHAAFLQVSSERPDLATAARESL